MLTDEQIDGISIDSGLCRVDGFAKTVRAEFAGIDHVRAFARAIERECSYGVLVTSTPLYEASPELTTHEPGCPAINEPDWPNGPCDCNAGMKN